MRQSPRPGRPAPRRLVLAVALGALCCWTIACGGATQSADVRIEPVQRTSAAVERAPSAGGGVPAGGARESGDTIAHGTRDRQTTVFLDPGHGGRDPGTSQILPGTPLEKDLTLDLARRTAAHLEALGYRVVLARTADADVNEPARDLNGDGCVDDIDELQARIDLANSSGASVLLSLHFNGVPGGQLSGSATYYNAIREFGADNERLAGLIQAAQLEALGALGHRARDWGVIRDDSFVGLGQTACPTGYPFYTILGPAAPARPRPSAMPGAIAEPLFLTHPGEAALAANFDVREALA